MTISKNRLDLPSVLIDLTIEETSDDCCQIQFNTRNAEYPKALMQEVMLKFPNTTWYAMEENCILQAKFFLKDGKVGYSERSVTEMVGDCVLSFQIEQAETRRPQAIYFLFADGRILFEDFLNNCYEEKRMDRNEKKGFFNQLDWLCQSVVPEDIGGMQ
ncbi:hypothetical protein [Streptococcus sp. DD11]|uniref:hypothetical protein n=1 Tax=Streptococcus sp. DD11 TaxID=1777879 RepID=UPI001008372B|nr:hypothetical protein [Streptococcus sp. DD11]